MRYADFFFIGGELLTSVNSCKKSPLARFRRKKIRRGTTFQGGGDTVIGHQPTRTRHLSDCRINSLQYLVSNFNHNCIYLKLYNIQFKKIQLLVSIAIISRYHSLKKYQIRTIVLLPKLFMKKKTGLIRTAECE